MPSKIKFIKDDDEGILVYSKEEDAEKFDFRQILTARFDWGSNDAFLQDLCSENVIFVLFKAFHQHQPQ